MFRQLVGNGANVIANINSLFTYHPLQLSALVETVWLNRNNAANSPTTAPFVPWAPEVAWQILNANFFTGYDWTGGTPVPIAPPATFVAPSDQPGLGQKVLGLPLNSTNWDHMIYAYIIENTRIFEIFSKVLETYMFTEQLETPSPASQLFWRNIEFLILGDAVPSMLWTTSSRMRRDEVADRLTSYFWMFGIDLSHAAQVAASHPYQKPAAANRDFIPTFESFGREVWRGIINAKNTSGANDSDAAVIATLARRLYDMMGTRRINGNLSREEFRAVAVMSYLHMAVMFDSPAVVDLKATASSPEMRLQKIAERVGMTAHPNSKPFFDLAAPFSQLMQGIETGTFNQPAGAQLLFKPPSAVSANAETVIDQYSLATGHDLKSQPVSSVPRANTISVPMSKIPPAQPMLGRHENSHGSRQMAKV
ncbi:MAG TPA: hypothetical protein VN828_18080 [Acidobacteriaceae bacterium]|nr:hypothetical protein [Acidobacteriaceae bacterium]